MTSNGIMEDIRGLLSQEMSAAEIISEGYAPSTVYRVRREAQRKSGMYQAAGSGSRGSACGLEYSTRLESDIRWLQRQLADMAGRLSELESAESTGQLWDRIHEFQEALSEVQSRQEQIIGELRLEKALLGKIDSELDNLAQVYKDMDWSGQEKWKRLPG